jgi:GDP-4-dehydro-6-deoxy-D-mannose reductase
VSSVVYPLTVKVLVTGATGFVGSHLCEYLIRQGDNVHGTFIIQSELDNFPDFVRQHVVLHRCDLTEVEPLRDVIKTVRPERVYHLAAISSVYKSWKGRDLVLRVNLFGWLHLLEALQEFCPEARVLMVSSGEVYGKVSEAQQPISETHQLRPLNPYAASKAAQELLCYQYIHAYQLPIVIVRPFNHTGPRQVLNFVCPDFAKQIAEVEKGIREPVIFVGNLETRRDFLDVRDVIRAYHLALEQCPIGAPVNVASGKAWSIQDILDMLLQFSKVPIEIRQAPDRLRPSDVPLMIGDYTLLYQQTGWQPAIPFKETLLSVLEYWRNTI